MGRWTDDVLGEGSAKVASSRVEARLARQMDSCRVLVGDVYGYN